MDNREAMIAVINPIIEKYKDHDLDHEFCYVDDDLLEHFSLEIWQAATAHNTDAVIDRCIEVTANLIKGLDAESTFIPTPKDALEACRRIMVSLKTNKEG